MRFALAGWCSACVAHDLLVAKAISSGRLFFVCAACSAAGVGPPTPDRSGEEQSINRRCRELAPTGWMLALVSEVGSLPIEGEIDGRVEELISWFSGFRFRSEAASDSMPPE